MRNKLQLNNSLTIPNKSGFRQHHRNSNELMRVLSNFYVLLLRKTPKLTRGKISSQDSFKHSDTVTELRAKNGTFYLMDDYPLRTHKMSETAYELWKCFNPQNSLEKIAFRFSKKYSISKQQALRDTKKLILQLIQENYLVIAN